MEMRISAELGRRAESNQVEPSQHVYGKASLLEFPVIDWQLLPANKPTQSAVFTL